VSIVTADVDDQDGDELCPEDYYYDWSTEEEEGSGELTACADTEFGCCPDGVTVAADAAGAGCPRLGDAAGCEDSEFGCCADGVTEARGPNPVTDCPCSAAEHGCCPDGLRPAAGRHGEGCGDPAGTGEAPSPTTLAPTSTSEVAVVNITVCADTEHGCCLDGVRWASGPQFAGCPEHGTYTETCEDTAFGCCPDGVAAADGPFNAGCAYQRLIARLYSTYLHSFQYFYNSVGSLEFCKAPLYLYN